MNWLSCVGQSGNLILYDYNCDLIGNGLYVTSESEARMVSLDGYPSKY